MQSIFCNIITASDDKIQYYKAVYLNIDKSKIVSITKKPENSNYIDKRDCLCLPGFIDIHVHLSQLYIKGKYAPDLLSWLKNYTYPAELMSKDADFARIIAEDFYKTCLEKGTTTTVVYTAPFAEACEIAFETARDLGVRSIIGMTMMDQNTPEYLNQTTSLVLENSIELWNRWHDRGRLDYIFTPRFALTCSETLLRETGRFIKGKGARLQTHLSENLNEIKSVNSLFPEHGSYTEVYHHYDLLGNRSIMGHGIHLSDTEMDLLKDTDTRIAYCPDSNLFLKSGRIKWQKLIEKGIKVGLASDVGAGTDLFMLNIMKSADYVLDKSWLNPEKSFYIATAGNAEVLGWEDKIGRIEKGKEADLVFVKTPSELAEASKIELLSWLIYLNYEVEIESTWVGGQELYNKDISGGNNENS